MKIPRPGSLSLAWWLPFTAGRAALAVALAAWLAPTTGVAASCVPPPSGLVGWWTADGDAVDMVGGHNGTIAGGATAGEAGLVGLAFTFDGTNGYVQIPDAAALKPANLTVEAWVRFTSLDSPAGGGSPAGDQYIVFKQNSSASSFEGFALLKTRVAGGDAFAFLVSSASGQTVEADSTTRISTGVWYHVAGVRGPSAVQIYVNGQMERQASVSFAQDYGNFPLYFGTSGQPTWDHKLAGVLDEVSLYNRALSAAEINSIFTAGAAGKCESPRVTGQPQGRSVAVGANVDFTATAAGTAPLFYQWSRDGTNLADGGNISGANSATLNVANAQVGDSAGYQAKITNSMGAATSAIAVLTVQADLLPPVITNQPASQTVAAGVNTQFPVGASGSGPLGYQWRFNGANLAEGGQFSGVATSVLSLSYALPANAGDYSVVVTNPAGAVTSSVASLSVSVLNGCLPPPAGLVGWWPGDGNANDIVGTNNGTLQGGATASASGVVGSAFSLDGTNGFVQIANAPELNPATLTVECWVRFHLLDTPGNSTTGAQYIVFKQNTRSSVFEGYNLSKHRYADDIFVWEASSAAGQPVQINSLSTITADTWYHVAGVRGSNYLQLYVNGLLEVEASVNFPQDYGDHPLYFGTSNQSYWDHKLSGAMDEVSLYDRPLSPAEIAALYAAGPAGKCKTPVIVSQPRGGSGYWGGAFTISAVASGVQPLACQWFKDGSPISGAINLSLSLTNLQAIDSGSYALRVTNSYGSAFSDPAVLAIKVADVTFTSSITPTQTLAGVGITGLAGQTYGIQSSDDLMVTNNWQNRTNLTLSGTAQVWYDPAGLALPQRYYRVVCGPIPLP